MVSTASCRKRQVPRFLQCLIESIALLLRTRILPVWAEGMTERALPLSFGTAF
jgi:hypothetical protein